MATKMEKIAVDGAIEETKSIKKKFDNDELIDCQSITSGELLMIGNRSKNLYSWADYGDIVGVEYQDLIYEIRSSRDSFATYPRFVILDENVIAQNKNLQTLYDSMYSARDIKEILKMSVDEIKKVIPSLPKGVRDSVKSLAATMISSGQLDSVSKIKALDELFGTEMLQTLADN